MDDRALDALLKDMAHLQQDPQYRWLLDLVRAEKAATRRQGPVAEETHGLLELCTAV